MEEMSEDKRQHYSEEEKCVTQKTFSSTPFKRNKLETRDQNQQCTLSNKTKGGFSCKRFLSYVPFRMKTKKPRSCIAIIEANSKRTPVQIGQAEAHSPIHSGHQHLCRRNSENGCLKKPSKERILRIYDFIDGTTATDKNTSCIRCKQKGLSVCEKYSGSNKNSKVIHVGLAKICSGTKVRTSCNSGLNCCDKKNSATRTCQQQQPSSSPSEQTCLVKMDSEPNCRDKKYSDTRTCERCEQQSSYSPAKQIYPIKMNSDSNCCDKKYSDTSCSDCEMSLLKLVWTYIKLLIIKYRSTCELCNQGSKQSFMEQVKAFFQKLISEHKQVCPRCKEKDYFCCNIIESTSFLLIVLDKAWAFLGYEKQPCPCSKTNSATKSCQGCKQQPFCSKTEKICPVEIYSNPNCYDKKYSDTSCSDCEKSLLKLVWTYVKLLLTKHKSTCELCNQGCKQSLTKQVKAYFRKLISEHKKVCPHCKEKEPSCGNLSESTSFLQTMLDKAWECLGYAKQPCAYPKEQTYPGKMNNNPKRCDKKYSDTSCSDCEKSLLEQVWNYITILINKHRSSCDRCNQKKSSRTSNESNTSNCSIKSLMDKVKPHFQKLISEHKKVCPHCKEKEPSCGNLSESTSFLQTMLDKAWEFLGNAKQPCPYPKEQTHPEKMNNNPKRCDKKYSDTSCSDCEKSLLEQVWNYITILINKHRSSCDRCNQKKSSRTTTNESNTSNCSKQSLMEKVKPYFQKLISEHKKVCPHCKEKEPPCCNLSELTSCLQTMLDKAWDFLGNAKQPCPYPKEQTHPEKMNNNPKRCDKKYSDTSCSDCEKSLLEQVWNYITILITKHRSSCDRCNRNKSSRTTTNESNTSNCFKQSLMEKVKPYFQKLISEHKQDCPHCKQKEPILCKPNESTSYLQTVLEKAWSYIKKNDSEQNTYCHRKEPESSVCCKSSPPGQLDNYTGILKYPHRFASGCQCSSINSLPECKLSPSKSQAPVKDVSVPRCPSAEEGKYNHKKIYKPSCRQNLLQDAQPDGTEPHLSKLAITPQESSSRAGPRDKPSHQSLKNSFLAESFSNDCRPGLIDLFNNTTSSQSRIGQGFLDCNSSTECSGPCKMHKDIPDTGIKQGISLTMKPKDHKYCIHPQNCKHSMESLEKALAEGLATLSRIGSLCKENNTGNFSKNCSQQPRPGLENFKASNLSCPRSCAQCKSQVNGENLNKKSSQKSCHKKENLKASSNSSCPRSCGQCNSQMTTTAMYQDKICTIDAEVQAYLDKNYSKIIEKVMLDKETICANDCDCLTCIKNIILEATKADPHKYRFYY